MLNISPTKKNIILNVMWALLGKIAALFSTLIAGIFIARHLGPEQYGLMNYVVSVVTLFTVIANFGTTEIILRELSRKDFEKEAILGSAFFIRICFAILSFILICVYLVFSNEEKHTIVLILIYSSIIFINCFDIIRLYFTSIIENKYIVKSELFRSIIGLIIKIILLFFNANIDAFVLALSIDFFLLSFGYIKAYKLKVGTIRKWYVDFNIVKKIINYSFPLLISSAAVIIYQRIDQVMIGKMLDNKSVGYFSCAISFITIVTFIPSIAIQTTSPLLVKYWQTNKSKYETESQKIMNITIWTTILICTLIALFSEFIINITYGQEYAKSIPVLQVLVFKAVGTALLSIGGQLIIIENIHKWAFIRNILSCIVCVILNYYMIPMWGIMGTAWATIITVVFTGCLSNIFFPQYIHILKKQLKSITIGYKDFKFFKEFITKNK